MWGWERTGTDSPGAIEVIRLLSPTTRLLALEAMKMPWPERKNLGRQQSTIGEGEHPCSHAALCALPQHQASKMGPPGFCGWWQQHCTREWRWSWGRPWRPKSSEAWKEQKWQVQWLLSGITSRFIVIPKPNCIPRSHTREWSYYTRKVFLTKASDPK